ncbi:MAG: hypothetical protein H0X15_14690 [Acidobacteria bacterium]|nr:hypothetical protein [Acidobacteriota bacterium]
MAKRFAELFEFDGNAPNVFFSRISDELKVFRAYLYPFVFRRYSRECDK